MKIKEIVTERLNSVLGEGNYRLICIAITGSHAYGIQTDESDFDIMGLFLPNDEKYFFGMENIEHVKIERQPFNKTTIEGTMYDLRFWYKLMSQQNPNVLELLWHVDASYVFKDSLIWPLLQQNRGQLLSKKLYHSFNGYAHSQVIRVTKLNKKANQNDKRRATIEKYGYDTKAAATAVRLIHTAINALTEGEITVMRPERQLLIAIREGRYTYDQLVDLVNAKEQLAGEAYVRSSLPKAIDRTFANQLLAQLIKTHLNLKMAA